MIKLHNIHKTYFGAAPLHVLKGIDLDVEKGEMIAVMGVVRLRKIYFIEHYRHIGQLRQGGLLFKRYAYQKFERICRRRISKQNDWLCFSIFQFDFLQNGT